MSRLFPPSPPVYGSGDWSHPSYQGYLAWTCDPDICGTTYAPASGDLMLVKLWLPHPVTISRLTTLTNVAGTGLTLARMALFDSTGAKVAETADMSAAFGTIGIKSGTVTPYAHPGGYGAYAWFGFLFVGTTAPGIDRQGGNAACVNSWADGSSPSGASLRVGRGGTGLAAMPASITPAAIANAYSVIPFAGVA